MPSSAPPVTGQIARQEVKAWASTWLPANYRPSSLDLTLPTYKMRSFLVWGPLADSEEGEVEFLEKTVSLASRLGGSYHVKPPSYPSHVSLH